MAATIKRNTCSSNIHKKVKAFMAANPTPAGVFADNISTFEAMYKAPAAQWNAYKEAKKAFSPTATLQERTNQAVEIGNAAVEIRKVAGKANSVITENFPKVTLSGLEASEVEQLNELITLLHKKMIVGNQKAATTGNPTQVVYEFIEDVKRSKVTGMIPPKYYKAHKIWAIFMHASQKGIAIEFEEDETNEEYMAILHQIDTLKNDAKPNNEGATLNMANKFAVDAFAATISHFKEHQPEASRTLDSLNTILKKAAVFTQNTSVGGTAWAAFVKAQKNYTNFLNGLTDGNSLYDNPAKLTKARFLACAGCMYPSADPTAIFGAADHTKAVPKLIAGIYSLEKENGEISDIVGTTSTAEHTLHLLLCLGERFNYGYNRNHIPHSVRQTTFQILN